MSDEMLTPIGEITLLLQRAGDDPEAAERLYQLVQHKLRQSAEKQMAKERNDHTLQATVLIDEAFVKLALTDTEFRDRKHFYCAAARAMRHILVDYDRKRKTVKRGRDWKRVPVELDSLPDGADGENVVAVDEALAKLAEENPALAEIVELHHFGGRTLEDVAAMLGVSERTAKRKWNMAKGWLYNAIRDDVS